jgi:hypothetical protein
LFVQDTRHTAAGFINLYSNISFNYFGFASAPINQSDLYFDTIALLKASLAIGFKYFVWNRQERDLPYPQSWSMICQKCPSQYSPLQTGENEISSSDKRQGDVHQDRWRIPSFLMGLGLFLASYGLLFHSSERFMEGGKWDLCLLLVNGLSLWCGLVPMMIGPRVF